MEKFLVSLVLFLIIGGFIIIEKYRKIKMVGNIYVKGYSLIEKKDRIKSFIYLIILILITLVSIFLLDYYYILLLFLILFLFNFIYPKNYYIGEQGISRSYWFPLATLKLRFFNRDMIKKINIRKDKSQYQINLVIEMKGEESSFEISVPEHKKEDLFKWKTAMGF